MCSDEVRLTFQERQLVILALLDRARTLRQLASGRTNQEDANTMRDEAGRYQALAEKIRNDALTKSLCWRLPDDRTVND